MASNMVKLPDGSEQDASTLICEGCEKSISEHSCGGSVTITTGGGAGRSTGPRKAPATRPVCPHCNGAVHFSMPGGLQNLECAMRQYFMDTKVIADPNARLPIYGLSEIAAMLAWNATLATPITYGRMESAAGGAGTYASLRPKADPKPAGERAKKRKAAEKGERIEDLAAAAMADDDGMSDNGDDLGGSAADGAVVVAAYEKQAKRNRKGKGPKVTKIDPDGAVSTVSLEDAVDEAKQQMDQDPGQMTVDPEPVEDPEAERARKRAERRAILAGTR